MCALDAGNAVTAEAHAHAARHIYRALEDPWGIVEATLLLVQAALYRGEVDEARMELCRCEEGTPTEAEVVQHRHLTLAWLAAVEGRW